MLIHEKGGIKGQPMFIHEKGGLNRTANVYT